MARVSRGATPRATTAAMAHSSPAPTAHCRPSSAATTATCPSSPCAPNWTVRRPRTSLRSSSRSSPPTTHGPGWSPLPAIAIVCDPPLPMIHDGLHGRAGGAEAGRIERRHQSLWRSSNTLPHHTPVITLPHQSSTHCHHTPPSAHRHSSHLLLRHRLGLAGHLSHHTNQLAHCAAKGSHLKSDCPILQGPPFMLGAV